MGCTPEAFLQVLSAPRTHLNHRNLCYENSTLFLPDKYRRERGCRYSQFGRSSTKNFNRIFADLRVDGMSYKKKRTYSLEGLTCKCGRSESVSAPADEDEKRTWINGMAIDSDISKFELAQQLKNENGAVFSNIDLGTPGAINSKLNGVGDSFEDEAWDLLRASMVYYCGNPIGTIAANDPNDSSISNYDQVFIRDFVPSGLAFLLKGEYDIVRSFILHTLQLQVIF